MGVPNALVSRRMNGAESPIAVVLVNCRYRPDPHKVLIALDRSIQALFQFDLRIAARSNQGRRNA